MEGSVLNFLKAEWKVGDTGKNVQHVKIYKKIPTVENVRQLCEELFLLKCISLLTHCIWLLK
jgi:hypothetical protein